MNAWAQAHYEEPFYSLRTAKLPGKLARLGVLNLNRQARILDAGCGKGEALAILQRYGFQQLSGADLLRHPEWQGIQDVRFEACDAIRTPFADGEFDAIINLHALHHMGSPEGVAAFLQECFRLLRPGGTVFILDYPGSPQINLLHLFLRRRLGTVTPGLKNFARIQDQEWSFLGPYLRAWPIVEQVIMSSPFRITSWKHGLFLYYLTLTKPAEHEVVDPNPVEAGLASSRGATESRSTSDPPYLSVVIPAYNESHRLPRTLDEIKLYLDDHFPDHEVIVVDDGSSDGTAELVDRRAALDWPRLRVLRQPHNLGKGAAVRRGCLEASGELVLFMDADHAVPIQEVERFIVDIQDRAFGVVAGVRTYQEQESKWRRIVGLSLQILAHLIVFRRAVIDSQCGFKLFRREAAQQIFGLCRVNGGMLDVELFHIMHLNDIQCYFEAVHWTNKEGSRINFVRCMLLDPIDMLKIRARGNAGQYRRPLRRNEQPWFRANGRR